MPLAFLLTFTNPRCSSSTVAAAVVEAGVTDDDVDEAVVADEVDVAVDAAGGGDNR